MAFCFSSSLVGHSRPWIHEGVDAGAGAGCGDGAGDVAVHDELGARAGVADLFDQRAVAVAVKDHDIELVDLHALCLGDEVQVLLHGQAEVNHVRGFRSGDQLLHVEHGGRIKHGATLSHCQDGQGVVDAEGSQPGSVDRVDGDVAFRAGAVTDAFTVEEHGGFVFFAFTDDNDAVEVDRLQEGTHGVHGSPVGGVLVTEAHPVAAGDGCSLRDAHQFKGKVAVRLIVANRQGR